jgi:hypothetical protein
MDDLLNDNRPGNVHASVASVVLDFIEWVSPEVCGKLSSVGFEITAVKR